MNKRILIYIAVLLLSLSFFASCSGKSATIEAGATDAGAIAQGASFAEGFDRSVLRAVGKHTVPVIIDGREVKYTVTVKDTTAPMIEVGEIHVNIGEGIAWKKQATVTDNSDGQIDIKVDSSKVNTSVAGTYTATYTATDPSGNSSTAQATVIVSEMTVTEEMLFAEIDKVIAQLITEDMTAEQKVRAVYDYVGKSINYVSTAKTDDYVYAAYMSLFSSGTGDCYSYFAASKAFFVRLGIENIDMERAEGGAPGEHYWNMVNIGTADAPKWYHYDANPISGKYSVSGCLLTDEQIEAYDEWRGEGYRKYDASGIPESAVEIITNIEFS